jgi:hypothetical protein
VPQGCESTYIPTKETIVTKAAYVCFLCTFLKPVHFVPGGLALGTRRGWQLASRAQVVGSKA